MNQKTKQSDQSENIRPKAATPKRSNAAAREKQTASGKTNDADRKSSNQTPVTAAVIGKRPGGSRAQAGKSKTGAKTVDSAKAAQEDKNMHILFVCGEAQPFVGTGGLGDVIGSLPKAIKAQQAGAEVRVILPLYESMHHDFRSKLQFVCDIQVPVSWRKQYCGLLMLEHEGIVFYFVDNEYYFKRHNIYGYYDDGERFTFFSRAVLELLPHLGWRTDILHCHDWHTALVPIYYKLYYMNREGYSGIKTIFTIHNIEYQGKYGTNIIEDVFGIPAKELGSIEFDGNINLMKGAIDYSDAVTTVSPTYAQELTDGYYAHGLEGILKKNSYKLRGILNGIDTDTYDPMTNPSLFQNYGPASLENKTVGKIELQKMIGLPVNPDIPMIAIISRLAPHKGLELVKFALHDIIMHDVQLVVLGTGSPALEEYFSHIQVEFNKKISTVIAYNKDLSQKIYAGADIFLMPSKSEPCGLCQMIACRYGTIPVVRATGGLKDTIADYAEGAGNGFVFSNFDVLDMTKAIDRAIGLYNQDKQAWRALMKRAMQKDFSWHSSAKEYIGLYAEMQRN